MDDSVARVTDGRVMMVRRARGYAPRPVWRTSAAAPDVLALGAGLKNTICWLKRGVAVMSQHLGDLSSAASLNAFERTVEALGRTLDAVPQVIAVDAHPDGPTFALGRRLARKWNATVVPVQHHQAHVLACAVENETPFPALGIAWDGTGFGTDGTVWGGEFLCWRKRVSRAGWPASGRFFCPVGTKRFGSLPGAPVPWPVRWGRGVRRVLISVWRGGCLCGNAKFWRR